MEALEKSDGIGTKKIGRVRKSKDSPARFRCNHSTGEFECGPGFHSWILLGCGRTEFLRV